MGTAAADSRRDDALESIEDWMANRWRDLRRLGSEAEAAGHEALGWAARTGAHIFAPRPSDVAAVGDQYRRAQDASAGPVSLTEVEPPQEIEKVEPGEGPDYGAPKPMDLGMRFQAARAGDNISRMIGSSDPRAVGKFLSLNGMDGRDSTIRAGRSYIVPTRWDDASDGEAKAGQALLGTDNARLQALAEQRAGAERRDVYPPLVTGSWDAATPVSRGTPARGMPGSSFWNWLDHSPIAKAAARGVGYEAGLARGVLRGGNHTVGDLWDGAQFVGRLMDPYDAWRSPPGQSAFEQTARLGLDAANYAGRVAQDPSILRDDIASGFHDFRLKQDLSATPEAPTARGELNRAFDIGSNNGELVFDVGSTLAGGELLRGAAGIGAAARAAGETESLLLKARPGLAAYLDQPYRGMGHHVLARRTRLPSVLGSGPVPSNVMESGFNKIRSEGLTNRDFFRNHVGVDDYYYGGKVPARFGGGSWSAKDLGWDKYGGYDRFHYGTAPATKGLAGSTLTAGQMANQFDEGARR